MLDYARKKFEARYEKKYFSEIKYLPVIFVPAAHLFVLQISRMCNI